MRVLVTGANGFVGSWLIRRLLQDGHEPVGAAGPVSSGTQLTESERAQVRWMPLDLTDPGSVAKVTAGPIDGVVHLAALSSVSESLRDPALAWGVNATGTARLLGALAERRAMGVADPVVLLVSSAEVYGSGEPRPRRETDPTAPCTPYAASKLGAELAGLETWRRTGLRVLIARPFPHTGPGQATRFVVPAFAERILRAKRAQTPVVKTGNLEPVRDLLDVRDVVAAYLLLLTGGTPGECYNVASGEGRPLEALFRRLTELASYSASPEPDPGLARPTDIRHLVGDPTKLRTATGWAPRITFDQTLHDVLDAQAD